MRAWIVGIVLALSAGSPAGRAAAPALLDSKGLLADVDVLQRVYGQLHPGLYRYNTPRQMQANFDALRRSLNHDQSLGEAYLAFSRFAAKVRCGHTYANFYNQSEATQAALFETPNRVPFHFRWLNGRMIVTQDFTPGKLLPRGTEVASIDGVPVSNILAKLMTVARADGSNDAKRRAQMEVNGDDRYEAFDVFLPLLFPQIGEEQMLRIRAPGDRDTRVVSVKALTQAQRVASRRVGGDDERAGWRMDIGTDGLAVLTMPDWALYDSKWDWKQFLQESFERIDKRNIGALVIDLRGNEGGLDVGNEILPHLIVDDLKLPNTPPLVRYRKVPEDLARYLDTWDPSFKDWGADAVPYDARFFRLKRFEDAEKGDDVVRPRAPRFRGRVFVLVGAANSSATFQFAEQMQQAKLGVLVGQPTGGNRRGINGGAFFFLRLPNSGIELDVPLIARFPAGHPPDAGLRPDVLVSPTIQDVATGIDAEMAAVRKQLLAHRFPLK